MKGTTNAQRGAADVVQNTSKVEVLGASLQNATDSQPGIMSAADHKTLTDTKTKADETATTLSTTVSRVSTCEEDLKGCFNDVSVSSDGSRLEFTALDGQVNSVPIPSGSKTLVRSGTIKDLVSGTTVKTIPTDIDLVLWGSYEGESFGPYYGTIKKGTYNTSGHLHIPIYGHGFDRVSASLYLDDNNKLIADYIYGHSSYTISALSYVYEEDIMELISDSFRIKMYT